MKVAGNKSGRSRDDDSEDATVMIPRPVRPTSSRTLWLGGGLAVLVVVAAGGVGWYVMPFRTQAPVPALAPPAPPPAVPIVVPPAPVYTLPSTASEAQILLDAPSATQAHRFAPAPDIFVLQFVSLDEQAATLNRAAGLVERAGFPHNHVLDDAELDRRIRAGGDAPATLYYGHDYRASDVVRFFETAEQDGQALTAQEKALLATIRGWGWTASTRGALISLVRADAAASLIDGPARATILRHELSHGMYFTNPNYAEYSSQFWNRVLTAAERAQFRAFLGSEGYDTAIEDLMINETQAYLMHTADTRFFNASAVGLTPARLDLLRGQFLVGMPPSWLRDCTSVPPTTPQQGVGQGALPVSAPGIAPAQSPR